MNEKEEWRQQEYQKNYAAFKGSAKKLVPASVETIKRWFETAQDMGMTHLIIVCDVSKPEDYPVYVGSSVDVQSVVELKACQSAQKVVEVYNLSVNIDGQLQQTRSWNL